MMDKGPSTEDACYRRQKSHTLAGTGRLHSGSEKEVDRTELPDADLKGDDSKRKSPSHAGDAAEQAPSFVTEVHTPGELATAHQSNPPFAGARQHEMPTVFGEQKDRNLSRDENAVLNRMSRRSSWDADTNVIRNAQPVDRIRRRHRPPALNAPLADIQVTKVRSRVSSQAPSAAATPREARGFAVSKTVAKGIAVGVAQAQLAMENRMASRAQSRQASHQISRRFSPRGSYATRGSPEAVQKNLLQAREVLRRFEEATAGGRSFDPHSTVAFRPVPSGLGIRRQSVSDQRLEDTSVGQEEVAAATGRGVASRGADAELVEAQAYSPTSRGSGKAEDKGGGLGRGMGAPEEDSNGLAAGTHGHLSRGEEPARLNASHAERMQCDLVRLVQLDEQRRASRIASRQGSRAVSRNPATLSPAVLTRRADVAKAAADELSRRLAADKLNPDQTAEAAPLRWRGRTEGSLERRGGRDTAAEEEKESLGGLLFKEKLGKRLQMVDYQLSSPDKNRKEDGGSLGKWSEVIEEANLPALFCTFHSVSVHGRRPPSDDSRLFSSSENVPASPSSQKRRATEDAESGRGESVIGRFFSKVFFSSSASEAAPPSPRRRRSFTPILSPHSLSSSYQPSRRRAEREGAPPPFAAAAAAAAEGDEASVSVRSRRRRTYKRKPLRLGKYHERLPRMSFAATSEQLKGPLRFCPQLEGASSTSSAGTSSSGSHSGRPSSLYTSSGSGDSADKWRQAGRREEPESVKASPLSDSSSYYTSSGSLSPRCQRAAADHFPGPVPMLDFSWLEKVASKRETRGLPPQPHLARPPAPKKRLSADSITKLTARLREQQLTIVREASLLAARRPAKLMRPVLSRRATIGSVGHKDPDRLLAVKPYHSLHLLTSATSVGQRQPQGSGKGVASAPFRGRHSPSAATTPPRRRPRGLVAEKGGPESSAMSFSDSCERIGEISYKAKNQACLPATPKSPLAWLSQEEPERKAGCNYRSNSSNEDNDNRADRSVSHMCVSENWPLNRLPYRRHSIAGLGKRPDVPSTAERVVSSREIQAEADSKLWRSRSLVLSLPAGIGSRAGHTRLSTFADRRPLRHSGSSFQSMPAHQPASASPHYRLKNEDERTVYPFPEKMSDSVIVKDGCGGLIITVEPMLDRRKRQQTAEESRSKDFPVVALSEKLSISSLSVYTSEQGVCQRGEQLEGAGEETQKEAAPKNLYLAVADERYATSTCGAAGQAEAYDVHWTKKESQSSPVEQRADEDIVRWRAKLIKQMRLMTTTGRAGRTAVSDAGISGDPTESVTQTETLSTSSKKTVKHVSLVLLTGPQTDEANNESYERENQEKDGPREPFVSASLRKENPKSRWMKNRRAFTKVKVSQTGDAPLESLMQESKAEAPNAEEHEKLAHLSTTFLQSSKLEETHTQKSTTDGGRIPVWNEQRKSGCKFREVFLATTAAAAARSSSVLRRGGGDFSVHGALPPKRESRSVDRLYKIGADGNWSTMTGVLSPAAPGITQNVEGAGEEEKHKVDDSQEFCGLRLFDREKAISGVLPTASIVKPVSSVRGTKCDTALNVCSSAGAAVFQRNRGLSFPEDKTPQRENKLAHVSETAGELCGVRVSTVHVAPVSLIKATGKPTESHASREENMSLECSALSPPQHALEAGFHNETYLETSSRGENRKTERPPSKGVAQSAEVDATEHQDGDCNTVRKQKKISFCSEMKFRAQRSRKMRPCTTQRPLEQGQDNIALEGVNCLANSKNAGPKHYHYHSVKRLSGSTGKTAAALLERTKQRQAAKKLRPLSRAQVVPQEMMSSEMLLVTESARKVWHSAGKDLPGKHGLVAAVAQERDARKDCNRRRHSARRFEEWAARDRRKRRNSVGHFVAQEQFFSRHEEEVKEGFAFSLIRDFRETIHGSGAAVVRRGGCPRETKKRHVGGEPERPANTNALSPETLLGTIFGKLPKKGGATDKTADVKISRANAGTQGRHSLPTEKVSAGARHKPEVAAPLCAQKIEATSRSCEASRAQRLEQEKKEALQRRGSLGYAEQFSERIWNANATKFAKESAPAEKLFAQQQPKDQTQNPPLVAHGSAASLNKARKKSKAKFAKGGANVQPSILAARATSDEPSPKLKEATADIVAGGSGPTGDLDERENARSGCEGGSAEHYYEEGQRRRDKELRDDTLVQAFTPLSPQQKKNLNERDVEEKEEESSDFRPERASRSVVLQCDALLGGSQIIAVDFVRTTGGLESLFHTRFEDEDFDKENATSFSSKEKAAVAGAAFASVPKKMASTSLRRGRAGKRWSRQGAPPSWSEEAAAATSVPEEAAREFVLQDALSKICGEELSFPKPFTRTKNKAELLPRPLEDTTAGAQRASMATFVTKGKVLAAPKNEGANFVIEKDMKHAKEVIGAVSEGGVMQLGLVIKESGSTKTAAEAGHVGLEEEASTETEAADYMLEEAKDMKHSLKKSAREVFDQQQKSIKVLSSVSVPVSSSKEDATCFLRMRGTEKFAGDQTEFAILRRGESTEAAVPCVKTREHRFTEADTEKRVERLSQDDLLEPSPEKISATEDETLEIESAKDAMMNVPDKAVLVEENAAGRVSCVSTHDLSEARLDVTEEKKVLTGNCDHDTPKAAVKNTEGLVEEVAEQAQPADFFLQEKIPHPSLNEKTLLLVRETGSTLSPQEGEAANSKRAEEGAAAGLAAREKNGALHLQKSGGRGWEYRLKTFQTGAKGQRKRRNSLPLLQPFWAVTTKRSAMNDNVVQRSQKSPSVFSNTLPPGQANTAPGSFVERELHREATNATAAADSFAVANSLHSCFDGGKGPTQRARRGENETKQRAQMEGEAATALRLSNSSKPFLRISHIKTHIEHNSTEWRSTSSADAHLLSLVAGTGSQTQSGTGGGENARRTTRAGKKSGDKKNELAPRETACVTAPSGEGEASLTAEHITRIAVWNVVKDFWPQVGAESAGAPSECRSLRHRGEEEGKEKFYTGQSAGAPYTTGRSRVGQAAAERSTGPVDGAPHSPGLEAGPKTGKRNIECASDLLGLPYTASQGLTKVSCPFVLKIPAASRKRRIAPADRNGSPVPTSLLCVSVDNSDRADAEGVQLTGEEKEMMPPSMKPVVGNADNEQQGGKPEDLDTTRWSIAMIKLVNDLQAGAISHTGGEGGAVRYDEGFQPLHGTVPAITSDQVTNKRECTTNPDAQDFSRAGDTFSRRDRRKKAQPRRPSLEKEKKMKLEMQASGVGSAEAFSVAVDEQGAALASAAPGRNPSPRDPTAARPSIRKHCSAAEFNTSEKAVSERARQRLAAQSNRPGCAPETAADGSPASEFRVRSSEVWIAEQVSAGEQEVHKHLHKGKSSSALADRVSKSVEDKEDGGTAGDASCDSVTFWASSLSPHAEKKTPGARQILSKKSTTHTGQKLASVEEVEYVNSRRREEPGTINEQNEISPETPPRGAAASGVSAEKGNEGRQDRSTVLTAQGLSRKAANKPNDAANTDREKLHVDTKASSVEEEHEAPRHVAIATTAHDGHEKQGVVFKLCEQEDATAAGAAAERGISAEEKLAQGHQFEKCDYLRPSETLRELSELAALPDATMEKKTTSGPHGKALEGSEPKLQRLLRESLYNDTSKDSLAHVAGASLRAALVRSKLPNSQITLSKSGRRLAEQQMADADLSPVRQEAPETNIERESTARECVRDNQGDRVLPTSLFAAGRTGGAKQVDLPDVAIVFCSETASRKTPVDGLVPPRLSTNERKDTDKDKKEPPTRENPARKKRFQVHVAANGATAKSAREKSSRHRTVNVETADKKEATRKTEPVFGGCPRAGDSLSMEAASEVALARTGSVMNLPCTEVESFAKLSTQSLMRSAKAVQEREEARDCKKPVPTAASEVEKTSISEKVVKQLRAAAATSGIAPRAIPKTTRSNSTEGIAADSCLRSLTPRRSLPQKFSGLSEATSQALKVQLVAEGKKTLRAALKKRPLFAEREAKENPQFTTQVEGSPFNSILSAHASQTIKTFQRVQSTQEVTAAQEVDNYHAGADSSGSRGASAKWPAGISNAPSASSDLLDLVAIVAEKPGSERVPLITDASPTVIAQRRQTEIADAHSTKVSKGKRDGAEAARGDISMQEEKRLPSELSMADTSDELDRWDSVVCPSPPFSPRYIPPPCRPARPSVPTLKFYWLDGPRERRPEKISVKDFVKDLHAGVYHVVPPQRAAVSLSAAQPLRCDDDLDRKKANIVASLFEDAAELDIDARLIQQPLAADETPPLPEHVYTSQSPFSSCSKSSSSSTLRKIPRQRLLNLEKSPELKAPRGEHPPIFRGLRNTEKFRFSETVVHPHNVMASDMAGYAHSTKETVKLPPSLDKFGRQEKENTSEAIDTVQPVSGGARVDVYKESVSSRRCSLRKAKDADKMQVLDVEEKSALLEGSAAETSEVPAAPGDVEHDVRPRLKLLSTLPCESSEEHPHLAKANQDDCSAYFEGCSNCQASSVLPPTENKEDGTATSEDGKKAFGGTPSPSTRQSDARVPPPAAVKARTADLPSGRSFRGAKGRFSFSPRKTAGRSAGLYENISELRSLGSASSMSSGEDYRRNRLRGNGCAEEGGQRANKSSFTGVREESRGMPSGQDSLTNENGRTADDLPARRSPRRPRGPPLSSHIAEKETLCAIDWHKKPQHIERAKPPQKKKTSESRREAEELLVAANETSSKNYSKVCAKHNNISKKALPFRCVNAKEASLQLAKEGGSQCVEENHTAGRLVHHSLGECVHALTKPAVKSLQTKQAITDSGITTAADIPRPAKHGKLTREYESKVDTSTAEERRPLGLFSSVTHLRKINDSEHREITHITTTKSWKRTGSSNAVSVAEPVATFKRLKGAAADIDMDGGAGYSSCRYPPLPRSAPFAAPAATEIYNAKKGKAGLNTSSPRPVPWKISVVAKRVQSFERMALKRQARHSFTGNSDSATFLERQNFVASNFVRTRSESVHTKRVAAAPDKKNFLQTINAFSKEKSFSTVVSTAASNSKKAEKICIARERSADSIFKYPPASGSAQDGAGKKVTSARYRHPSKSLAIEYRHGIAQELSSTKTREEDATVSPGQCEQLQVKEKNLRFVRKRELQWQRQPRKDPPKPNEILTLDIAHGGEIFTADTTDGDEMRTADVTHGEDFSVQLDACVSELPKTGKGVAMTEEKDTSSELANVSGGGASVKEDDPKRFWKFTAPRRERQHRSFQSNRKVAPSNSCSRGQSYLIESLTEDEYLLATCKIATARQPLVAATTAGSLPGRGALSTHESKSAANISSRKGISSLERCTTNGVLSQVEDAYSSFVATERNTPDHYSLPMHQNANLLVQTLLKMSGELLRTKIDASLPGKLLRTKVDTSLPDSGKDGLKRRAGVLREASNAVDGGDKPHCVKAPPSRPPSPSSAGPAVSQKGLARIFGREKKSIFDRLAHEVNAYSQSSRIDAYKERRGRRQSLVAKGDTARRSDRGVTGSQTTVIALPAGSSHVAAQVAANKPVLPSTLKLHTEVLIATASRLEKAAAAFSVTLKDKAGVGISTAGQRSRRKFPTSANSRDREGAEAHKATMGGINGYTSLVTEGEAHDRCMDYKTERSSCKIGVYKQPEKDAPTMTQWASGSSAAAVVVKRRTRRTWNDVCDPTKLGIAARTGALSGAGDTRSRRASHQVALHGNGQIMDEAEMPLQATSATGRPTERKCLSDVAAQEGRCHEELQEWLEEEKAVFLQSWWKAVTVRKWLSAAKCVRDLESSTSSAAGDMLGGDPAAGVFDTGAHDFSSASVTPVEGDAAKRIMTSEEGTGLARAAETREIEDNNFSGDRLHRPENHAADDVALSVCRRHGLPGSRRKSFADVFFDVIAAETRDKHARQSSAVNVPNSQTAFSARVTTDPGCLQTAQRNRIQRTKVLRTRDNDAESLQERSPLKHTVALTPHAPATTSEEAGPHQTRAFSFSPRVEHHELCRGESDIIVRQAAHAAAHLRDDGLRRFFQTEASNRCQGRARFSDDNPLFQRRRKRATSVKSSAHKNCWGEKAPPQEDLRADGMRPNGGRVRSPRMRAAESRNTDGKINQGTQCKKRFSDSHKVTTFEMAVAGVVSKQKSATFLAQEEPQQKTCTSGKFLSWRQSRSKQRAARSRRDADSWPREEDVCGEGEAEALSGGGEQDCCRRLDDAGQARDQEGELRLDGTGETLGTIRKRRNNDKQTAFHGEGAGEREQGQNASTASARNFAEYKEEQLKTNSSEALPVPEAPEDSPEIAEEQEVNSGITGVRPKKPFAQCFAETKGLRPYSDTSASWEEKSSENRERKYSYQPKVRPAREHHNEDRREIQSGEASPHVEGIHNCREKEKLESQNLYHKKTLGGANKDIGVNNADSQAHEEGTDDGGELPQTRDVKELESLEKLRVDSASLSLHEPNTIHRLRRECGLGRSISSPQKELQSAFISAKEGSKCGSRKQESVSTLLTVRQVPLASQEAAHNLYGACEDERLNRGHARTQERAEEQNGNIVHAERLLIKKVHSQDQKNDAFGGVEVRAAHSSIHNRHDSRSQLGASSNVVAEKKVLSSFGLERHESVNTKEGAGPAKGAASNDSFVEESDGGSALLEVVKTCGSGVYPACSEKVTPTRKNADPRQCGPRQCGNLIDAATSNEEFSAAFEADDTEDIFAQLVGAKKAILL